MGLVGRALREATIGAMSLTSSSVTPHNRPGRAPTGTADLPDEDPAGGAWVDPPPIWVTATTADGGDHRHRSQNTDIPAPIVNPRPDQEDTVTTSEALEVLAGLAASLTVMRTV